MGMGSNTTQIKDKIEYVQREGVILTLKPSAPINKRQIIVNNIKILGDGIAIHCPFNNVFLMNSIQALVDIVDWEWMEENVCMEDWNESY